MPITATVHRVMIASPGDVQAERNIVREVLNEWNSVNGARRQQMLLPLGWETDVAPEMGDQPQNIINKRILADADMLVGIFWTRLGTPTANYASGAVEEIEEHLKAKRPAMLYFSTAPAALDSVDPQQYSALKAFKDSCKSRGLFVTYSDVEDFRRKFSKDLQIVMNTADAETDQNEPTPIKSSKPPALSMEAKRLLKAASSSEAGGVILFERFGGGAQIQASDQVFNEDSSPRTLALWESAIEELERQGLVKATSEKREVFEVTHQGFAASDALTD